MPRKKPDPPAKTRNSKFKPEFVEQARKLAERGWVDEEIAGFFGVCRRTLLNWQADHPELVPALTLGKNAPNQRVIRSLYHRATGYSHDAVKIFYDQKKSKAVKVPYVEHCPPDVVACIFWLKNRLPAEWRDRVDHSVNPSDSNAIGEQLVTLWLDEMKLAREQLKSSLPPPTREDAIRLLSKFRPEVAALAGVEPASDKIQ